MTHFIAAVILPEALTGAELDGKLSDVLAPFDEDRISDGQDHNPHAQWDWWVVGGRWESHYQSRQGESVASLIARLEQTKADLAAGVNCNPHKGDPHANGGDLPWYFPHHLLTLDGVWREAGHVGWFGYRSEDMTAAQWVDLMIATLAGEPADAVVYYVDLHI